MTRRDYEVMRQHRRNTCFLVVLIVLFVIVIITLLLLPVDPPNGEPENTPPPIVHVISVSPEAEEPNEPSEDAVLLAKIMSFEDGIDWPDPMVLALGEVVLNRVASPDFPNTVREVLYQDDGGFIQYAPVHTDEWETAVPDEHYIELAEKLLDGYRVLKDEDVVYQALFTQGSETVFSYTDAQLGPTTYFCKRE